MPFRFVTKVTDYSCRFIPDQTRSIYAIAKPHQLIHMTRFASIPFHNRHTQDNSNALVAFECQDLAKAVAADVGEGAQVLQCAFNDFVHISSMVKLPVIIITNMYCAIDSDKQTSSTHFEVVYQDARYARMTIGKDDKQDYP